jgi:hypothetical protein
MNEEMNEEINEEISGETGEHNKETTKVLKVSFGGIFFTRELPKAFAGVDSVTPDMAMANQCTQDTLHIFTHYIGLPTNAIITETKRHRVPKPWTPNNARVRIQYETLNSDTIWPELHNKVALKRRTPTQSFTLFSVFGNIIYCPFEKEIECTAVRNLSHVSVLSKITRDETHNRGPSAVLLMRYALSGHIGHNIQTRSNCMLEVMLLRVFRSAIQVVPRTEEDISTVYFRIPSMKQFNETLEQAPALGIPSAATPPSAIIEHMEQCTAYVQVTYLGTMFVRYVWDTNHPLISLAEIDHAKSFFMATTTQLANIVNTIS